MASKGMRGTSFVPQGVPPQEPQDDSVRDEEAPRYDSTTRDSRGRFPSALNVGGTHSSKKHPASRHVRD